MLKWLVLGDVSINLITISIVKENDNIPEARDAFASRAPFVVAGRYHKQASHWNDIVLRIIQSTIH